VDNCGTSDASNIAVNLQYATIRNSISVNGTGTDNGNGITIGHEGWPAIESVCENNLFLNNSAKGVFLQGTTTRDIIVRNNIILNNGVGSSGLNSGGIAVYVGIQDSVMTNNEILGNRLGISFMQTSADNLAENNRIKSSTMAGVRSDGINNTLKDNELANSTNVAHGINEVNLVEVNNTETGEQPIDYSYLLDLPLTDLQRSVLQAFLD
jgi:nitrous oxidase accessory protein NosD